MAKVYGYCRCSTDEKKQDIDRQVRELKEMGATDTTIYKEYISGLKKNKAEFQKLLDVIQPGDVLTVTDISRLTRSTKHLCEIIEIVKEKKIKLVIKNSITIDCTNGSLDPMTAAFLQITGVFAELERNIISERTKSGIRNAAAKGKKIGRPALTADNIFRFNRVGEYYIRYGNGELDKKFISQLLGISRPTLYAYFGYIEREIDTYREYYLMYKSGEMRKEAIQKEMNVKPVTLDTFFKILDAEQGV